MTEKRRPGRPKKDKADISHNIDRRGDQLLTQSTSADEDEILMVEDVAVWLRMSVAWLNRGRQAGFGPPFINLGPNRIAYRRGDVRDWIKSRTFQSTAEYR
jgi:predicted DNA-binding transcriptional regulator AlpA